MKNKKIYTPPTFEPFTTEERMKDIGIVAPSGTNINTDDPFSKNNNIDTAMSMEEEEAGSNPRYKNYCDLN